MLWRSDWAVFVLLSTGVPSESGAGVSWLLDENRTLVDLRLHFGSRHLWAKMRKETVNATDVTGNFQVHDSP